MKLDIEVLVSNLAGIVFLLSIILALIAIGASDRDRSQCCNYVCTDMVGG